MFSENKKGKTSTDTEGQPNRIGSKTKIIGDMISSADLRIDGELEGSVKTQGKVVIGKEGLIKGKVECKSADIEGKMSGELFVSNVLTLKSSAYIEGSVTVAKLAVEPGATFNASCTMSGNAGEIKPIKTQETKKAEKTA
ncbi:polymer-forming cytoskeletal protein [Sungkyunkwania multivorans]|uniref:Polymer-forming cytoskeletal protein n=1 Tax=Sungkyunkwania multivorans TaxID=1173618 RepID=A0ABW3CZW8_9FLAO